MKFKHLILVTTTLVVSHSVLAISANQGFYLAAQAGAAFNNITDISQSNKKRTADKLAWGINGGYNYKIKQPILT